MYSSMKIDFYIETIAMWFVPQQLSTELLGHFRGQYQDDCKSQIRWWANGQTIRKGTNHLQSGG